MEFIVELILELFIEEGIEVSHNKKVSKWIRYPILALWILFFATVILGLIIIGIWIIPDIVIGGIFMIMVGFIMLCMFVFKFRKKYSEMIHKK